MSQVEENGVLHREHHSEVQVCLLSESRPSRARKKERIRRGRRSLKRTILKKRRMAQPRRQKSSFASKSPNSTRRRSAFSAPERKTRKFWTSLPTKNQSICLNNPSPIPKLKASTSSKCPPAHNQASKTTKMRMSLTPSATPVLRTVTLNKRHQSLPKKS